MLAPVEADSEPQPDRVHFRVFTPAGSFVVAVMDWVAPATNEGAVVGEVMPTPMGVMVKLAVAIADGFASDAAVTVAALLHPAGTGAGAL